MSKLRLEIAYDGTRFSGWARQAGLRTVQGEIEAALERLFGAPAPITVAGRTDAGVHALGQVASLEPPPGSSARDPETLLRALNALTPDDVEIAAVTEAEPRFDARRSARSRRYRYRVSTSRFQSPFEWRYSLHWPYPLDRGLLDGCAALLVGEHDFTAFTPTDTEHVRFRRRVLDAGWSREEGSGGVADGPVLRFEIEADAFMRNMVRALVGTMLEVGAGRRTPEQFASLLGGRPRAEAGETAAARGLFLVGVRY